MYPHSRIEKSRNRNTLKNIIEKAATLNIPSTLYIIMYFLQQFDVFIKISIPDKSKNMRNIYEHHTYFIIIYALQALLIIIRIV